MIGAGVPRGTTSEFHVFIWYPSSPLSAIVGTSGTAADRFAVETARTRSLPDAVGGTAADIPAKMEATSPAMRSVIAGELPLYGICTTSTRAMYLKSSA